GEIFGRTPGPSAASDPPPPARCSSSILRARVLALRLQHFPHQLDDLGPGGSQRAPASGGDPVVLANASLHEAPLQAEIPPAGEITQDQVERAGAQRIALAAELFDQPEPVDGLLGGVVEHVDADEAEEEIAYH